MPSGTPLPAGAAGPRRRVSCTAREGQTQPSLLTGAPKSLHTLPALRSVTLRNRSANARAYIAPPEHAHSTEQMPPLLSSAAARPPPQGERGRGEKGGLPTPYFLKTVLGYPL
jgi:hypothetical protein